MDGAEAHSSGRLDAIAKFPTETEGCSSSEDGKWSGSLPLRNTVCEDVHLTLTYNDGSIKGQGTTIIAQITRSCRDVYNVSNTTTVGGRTYGRSVSAGACGCECIKAKIGACEGRTCQACSKCVKLIFIRTCWGINGHFIRIVVCKSWTESASSIEGVLFKTGGRDGIAEGEG